MNIYSLLQDIDLKSIQFMRKYGDECARIAFFIVFFWFGILKVFSLSPAQPLVSELFNVTFLSNLMPSSTFLILFGLFEVIIGFMALVPKLERITFIAMGFHLITTALPLFILPEITWAAPFVPTLTGQYIIKNVVLFSLGMMLFARVKPIVETHHLIAEEQEFIPKV